MAEIAAAVVGAITVGYGLIKKAKYKNLKRTIYREVREAIAELDFEKIHTAIDKLKKFDAQFMDIATGLPIKGLFEKLRCKERLAKMEKLEKLFGITLEDVKSIEATKEWVEKMKNNVEDIGKELGIIEEEEKKDNAKVELAKKKLEQLKTKHLLTNTKQRQVVDGLNLTDIIQNIHKDYEELLMKELGKEFDVKSILERNVKKQLLNQQ